MDDGQNRAGRGRSGGASIDAVLREVLRQGRLDPAAERLAAQGVERLRNFLGGDPSVNGGPGAAPASSSGGPSAPEPVDAEDVEEDVALDVTLDRVPLLRHEIPLRGGGRAEVHVPEDLTRDDARRIAAVLQALAIDDVQDPA